MSCSGLLHQEAIWWQSNERESANEIPKAVFVACLCMPVWFQMQIVLSVQACVAHHSGIEHILSMFFRDDVMAWNKRAQGKAPGSSPRRPAELKALVLRNTKDCIARLQQVRAPATCPCASPAI